MQKWMYDEEKKKSLKIPKADKKDEQNERYFKGSIAAIVRHLSKNWIPMKQLTHIANSFKNRFFEVICIYN